MTELQRTASVHPGTITQVSQGQHEHEKGRREELSPRRPYSTRVDGIKVSPMVWKLALERCAGDPRRIEIVSETEVYIHNSVDWRKR